MRNMKEKLRKLENTMRIGISVQNPDIENRIVNIPEFSRMI